MRHDKDSHLYHLRYSNIAFRAIYHAVLADFWRKPDITDKEISASHQNPVARRLFRLLIDVAIEATGSRPFPMPRHLELAQLAAEALRPDTWTAIGSYLQRFDPDGEVGIAADFPHLVRVVAYTRDLPSTIEMPILSAAKLHSPTGHAVHHLLVSAEALAAAVNIALYGSQGGYLQEKLSHAKTELQRALNALNLSFD